MLLSGAQLEKNANPGYYWSLVKQCFGQKITATDEIERDLYRFEYKLLENFYVRYLIFVTSRSLPEHPAFQDASHLRNSNRYKYFFTCSMSYSSYDCLPKEKFMSKLVLESVH